MKRREAIAVFSAGVVSATAGCSALPFGDDDELLAEALDRMSQVDEEVRSFASPESPDTLDVEHLEDELDVLGRAIDDVLEESQDVLGPLHRFQSALVEYNGAIAGFLDALAGDSRGWPSYYNAESSRGGDPATSILQALQDLERAHEVLDETQAAYDAVDPAQIPDGGPAVTALEPRLYFTEPEMDVALDLFSLVEEYQQVRVRMGDVFVGAYRDEKWEEAIEAFEAIETEFDRLAESFDALTTQDQFPDRLRPDLEYHREMSVLGKNTAELRREIATASLDGDTSRAIELRREMTDLEGPSVPRSEEGTATTASG